MDEAQKHIYNYRSPRESIDSDSSVRVDLKNQKVPSIIIANNVRMETVLGEEIKWADKSVNLCGLLMSAALFSETDRRPPVFDGHSG